MMVKVCCKCGVKKKFDEFGLVIKSKDGRRSSCKECSKIGTKEYRKKNKDKRNEDVKKWRDNNPEKYKNSYIKYRKNNPEKIKKYYITNKDKIKNYRKNNLDKIKEIRKKYYKKNKDKLLEINKKYQEKNKEKYKIKYNIWLDNNREKNLKYKKKSYKKNKLSNAHIIAWRSVLYNTLKRVGSKKESKTNELLGYSPIELKEHIEKKFIDGMFWDNWGKWHLDHIKPVSSFDKSEKMSIINSLDNLQPLWAVDNLKKSNKIIK